MITKDDIRYKRLIEDLDLIKIRLNLEFIEFLDVNMLEDLEDEFYRLYSIIKGRRNYIKITKSIPK